MSRKDELLRDEQIANLSLSELIDLLKRVADEIEIRMMETAIT